MDMVRWILGPKWVLDITKYMMNVVVMVRWTLGPERVLVITIKFIETPFCVITSISFSFFILDMGYPSFLPSFLSFFLSFFFFSFFSCLRHFFTHALSMVFFTFFFA
jgi:hypothetical protein